MKPAEKNSPADSVVKFDLGFDGIPNAVRILPFSFLSSPDNLQND
jgi:hypothetical protein